MAQPKIKKTLEERLKHIEKRENGVVIPENGNLAKLLLDSLKSKDQRTMEALLGIEEQLIVRAVQRLRKDIILDLIRELTEMIKQNRNLYHSGILWMKHIVQKNASILMSCPDLPELTTMTNIIEERIALQDSLGNLQGIFKYFLNRIKNKDNDLLENEILDMNEGDLTDSDELDLSKSPEEEDDGSSEDDEELSP